MKTADLSGALLDYYVARAEGIPAEQLSFYNVPRTDLVHVVRDWTTKAGITEKESLMYSTDWAQGGPLLDKYRIELTDLDGDGWLADVCVREEDWTKLLGYATGDKPLEAICRAVVSSAFGDEAPDEVKP